MPSTTRPATYHIGALATDLNLNPKTIRYYEQIGLLPEPQRTPSGYRLYGVADRDRLAFVAKAKAVGLTLDQIRQIIARRDTGSCPCDHVLNLIDDNIAAIDTQLSALTILRQELSAIKHATPTRSPGDSVVCGIIEHHQPSRTP